MVYYKKIREICLLNIIALALAAAPMVFAGTETVIDQDAAYKYKRQTPEQAFARQTTTPNDLHTDLTVGIAQGIDTNPLLDSTHKADTYTQETLDMRFKYKLPENSLGKLDSRFGFNIFNINYYKSTDVNIFDGVADINFDQQLSEHLTATVGYALETMWFPNDRNGNYLGNEISAGFKQDLTKSIYQRVVYRLQFRNYLDRKAMLGNGNFMSDLRFDIRNTFRHELGVYIGKKIKLRVIDDLIVNNSNDQFFDFYDYNAYRTGGSLVAMFTGKLYGTAGLYYQRKWYYSRIVSAGDYPQRDNLYTAAASLTYEITKNLSIFANYTHMENHSNEPLEQYIDTLCYGGFNYAF